jgi:type VI secretion system protein ImpL
LASSRGLFGNHGENKGNLHEATTAEDKKPFIESTGNNEKQPTSAARTYNVEISILPATANHGAQQQPHSVTLELHSGKDTQSIMALNYPISKLFVWSPEISGDVILSISITGDLVLTKKYPGRLGFPEFLREFHKGNRVFRTNEFNPEESKVLKDCGIEFLSISFIIRGAEPVMQYLSQ